MYDAQGFAGKYTSPPKTSTWVRLLEAIFPSLTILMEKKFPDISFYQGKVDFDKMRVQTDAVIIRAGQNVWIDAQFVRNWTEAKRVGMRRGTYWFYDDRINPIVQAGLWVDLVKNDRPEMELFADWENTYNGPYNKLSHVVQFMQAVEAALPGATVGIYTGYYWFKDHSNPTANAAEYAYLKNRPLWMAWYTSNPANVLLPAPWTKITHWQYGTPALGALYGTETTEIDMNYFNGSQADFEARYPAAVPTPPQGKILLDEREYFPGAMIRHYDGPTVHGRAIYHVVEIDTAQAEFYVSPSGKAYVPTFLQNHQLDIAVNLDGFNGEMTMGYGASEGKPYAAHFTEEETIWISALNVFSLSRQSPLWNAFSFPNRLVWGGALADINKDPNDVRARTAFGITQDQKKVFLVVVDGGDYTVQVGMSFLDVAQVLLELGCYTGCMFDGGGSTTLAVNDNGETRVLGVPFGEDLVQPYNKMLRRVANIFGVRMKSDSTPPPPPPEGQAMYTVKKSVAPRATPSMYETNKKTDLVVGVTFDSAVVQTLDAVPPIVGQIGPISWVQMPDGYWVPLEYKGMTYVKLTGSTPPPPPPPPPVGPILDEIKVMVDGTVYRAGPIILTKV